MNIHEDSWLSNQVSRKNNKLAMHEDSWLSSQMINLTAAFMALFVRIISYCAQGCILELQTMLPKGVFIFFA